MRHFSLNTINELPGLYDYLYDDNNVFCPEKLVIKMGLYESVKIDVSNMITHSILPTPIHGCELTRIVTDVDVSEDVRALHEFINFTHSILLPCPECVKTLAFIPKSFGFYKEDDENDYLPIGDRKENVFNPASLKYSFGYNQMKLSSGDHSKVDLEQGIESCVKGILDHIKIFQRYFECTLNPNHHIYIDFIIYRAIDACKKPMELKEYEKRKKLDPSTQMTPEEKEIVEKYYKLKHVLILEKVGQEPSMADLQLFDIEKYKSVLSKERFRDFSMALGLNASGVGCGSLLYLRRVFESVTIMVQNECENLPDWDKKEYESKRFNEKIDYLEGFGKKIIPDELSEVKTKIYGYLSKGVHELTEQEALELFPYLKFSIELVLDNQMAQKERSEKIRALSKKLNS